MGGVTSVTSLTLPIQTNIKLLMRMEKYFMNYPLNYYDEQTDEISIMHENFVTRPLGVLFISRIFYSKYYQLDTSPYHLQTHLRYR